MGWAAFAASAAGMWMGPGPSSVLSLVCAGTGVLALLWSLAGFLRPDWPLARVKFFSARRVRLAGCALLSAALMLVRISGGWHTQVTPYQQLDGQTAYARIQVLNYPEKSFGRYRYRAKVTLLDYTQVKPFIMQLTSSAPLPARPYEQTECQVRFSKPEAGGLYSQQNRLLAEGCVIRGSTYGGSVRVRNSVWPPGRIAEEARRIVSGLLSQWLPSGEAGFIRRIMLGQSDGFPEIANSYFSKIGCSHMLAVSGLHLAIVAGLVSLACRRIAGGRREKNLIRALLLFTYMCVTGFPVGVLRSGIMFLLYLTMDSIYASIRSQNSLGTAVLLICLFRPFSGGDLGFALSALSTLGIITLYKPMFSRLVLAGKGRRRGFPRWLHPFLSSLCVTWSAVLFTLPVLLLSFEGLSLVSPLANFLLLPLLTALLYCSALLLFTALISQWWPILAGISQPFAFFAGWLVRGLLGVARWLARLPGVFFHIDQGIWMPALCAVVLLAVLLRQFRRLNHRLAGRVPVKRLAAVGIILLLLGAQIRWQHSRDWITLAVAGSQESPCVILMKNNRAAVLSLGGYQSTAAEEILEDNHILSLEGIFLPVTGAQSRAMAAYLGELRSPGWFLLPEGAYAGKDLQGLGEETYIAPGDSFQALPGIDVTFHEDGRRLSFPVQGSQAILELEASGEGSCGILVSCSPQTEIQGEWTILLEEEEKPGLYLWVSPEGEVYLKEM